MTVEAVRLVDSENKLEQRIWEVLAFVCWLVVLLTHSFVCDLTPTLLYC